MEYPSILRKSPPVAKLDIAVDSDSKGRGFESLRAGQKQTDTYMVSVLYLSIVMI